MKQSTQTAPSQVELVLSPTTMARIYWYFVRNPCARGYEAAEALGYHKNTISHAARAIRAGWTPLSGGQVRGQ